MTKETIKAAIWGLAVAGLLAVLIIAGSRNLAHFDAALVAYTFATVFASFGVTYRYAMWLQRPPTALYWRRGWQVFLRPKDLGRNLVRWAARLVHEFAFNHFIFKRGRARWGAHWLIMWGCLTAVAITFPLVFGWIHFETLPDDTDWYRAYLFGFPTFAFPIHSVLGFLIFHGLVWSSVLVIAGVMLAMRRRMRDHGAAALQQFAEDFLPLILLFAISATGLMLTASYTWMKGYAYDFLAILHAITVIFTLLWLPFGKFFHIFQRPAQLGVSFYQDAGAREEP
ncbi:MAG TPA: MFS transporter, partial [Blastocatellia bacterium]|nr:MFS transporter [Blastocatellia bacterium]